MFVITFFAIVTSVVLAMQNKTSVIVCDSVFCTWNKRCTCTRKKIAIYDNKAKGMCLYYMSTAKAPVRRERIVERGGIDYKMLDKIMELQDEVLLKDPDAFAKWMKMNCKKERKGRMAMNPVFRYRAKDAQGIDKDGEIEAVDDKAAAKGLQEKGLFVISLDRIEQKEKSHGDKLAKDIQQGVTVKCLKCEEVLHETDTICPGCGQDLTSDSPLPASAGVGKIQINPLWALIIVGGAFFLALAYGTMTVGFRNYAGYMPLLVLFLFPFIIGIVKDLYPKMNRVTKVIVTSIILLSLYLVFKGLVGALLGIGVSALLLGASLGILILIFGFIKFLWKSS